MKKPRSNAQMQSLLHDLAIEWQTTSRTPYRRINLVNMLYKRHNSLGHEIGETRRRKLHIKTSSGTRLCNSNLKTMRARDSKRETTTNIIIITMVFNHYVSIMDKQFLHRLIIQQKVTHYSMYILTKDIHLCIC